MTSNECYQSRREKFGTGGYRVLGGQHMRLNDTPPEPEYTLDDSTSPEAIRADQRRVAVWAWWAIVACGEEPTLARVAEAAVLPKWVAWRRLGEAGLMDGPAPKSRTNAAQPKPVCPREVKRTRPLADDLARHLRTSGLSLSTGQLATATCHCPNRVARAVLLHSDLFRLDGYVNTGHRPARRWAAKEAS